MNSYTTPVITYMSQIFKTITPSSFEDMQKTLSTEYSKLTNIYKSEKTNATSKKHPSSSTLNQNLNLKEKILDNSLPFKRFTNLSSSDPNASDKIASLCGSIEKASSHLMRSTLVSDLFKILYESDSNVRYLINKNEKRIIPVLLELRKDALEKKEKVLHGNINECLSLLGHVEPHPFKTINILSLDGGGAKGFVTIEILKNIQKQCGGKPIYEIFDYIVGVSTGGIIGVLIGDY